MMSSVIIISLISCDSFVNKEEPAQDFIDVQTLEKSVEEISIEPTDPYNLDGSYDISISFDESIRNKKMPDGFVIQGISDAQLIHRNKEENVLFSGTSNSEKIKKMYINSISDNIKSSPDRLQGLSFECNVSFTSPGEYDENCDDTCSETSLFGGSTWFCVCFYECKVDLDLF